MPFSARFSDHVSVFFKWICLLSTFSKILDRHLRRPPFTITNRTYASLRAIISSQHKTRSVFRNRNDDPEVYSINNRITELSRSGRIDKAQLLFDRMLRRDVVTWNTLIAGYFVNGRTEKALELFDKMPERNSVSWTTIVSGYAQNGRVSDARMIFDGLSEKPISCWNAMITGYVRCGMLEEARHLFDEMPERNNISWNTLMTGYVRKGEMREAQKLFHLAPNPNLVSWSIMISGYVHSGNGVAALELFSDMRRAGIEPNRKIFTAVLCAASSITENPNEKVKILHSIIASRNLDKDTVIGTALVNAYVKCGNIDVAVRQFDSMPERNEYTWTTILSGFAQSGRLEEAGLIFDQMPEKSPVSWSTMVSGYARIGDLETAEELYKRTPDKCLVSQNVMITAYAQNGRIGSARIFFDQMGKRDVVSWSSMIAGYAQQGQEAEALKLFVDMQRENIKPTQRTYVSAINACAHLGVLEDGKQIQAHSIKTGFLFDHFVGNTLLTMYAKCNHVEGLSRVFDGLSDKNLVPSNAAISGYALNSKINNARKIFDMMDERNLVSWTAMITGYVQNGDSQEALRLYIEMLRQGTRPNESTFSSILTACADLGALNQGKQVQATVIKVGLNDALFVGNSLVTMYAKCGGDETLKVFNEMPYKDVISWNAIIGGLAQHGQSSKALDFFEQMKVSGVMPNAITFVSVLSACSYTGLVEKGKHYFESMIRDYQIVPCEKHYACMVDLLGRSGLLDEARDFIDNMPVEPDAVVWGALLGACRIYPNAELATYAAEKLFQLEPHNSGNYTLLSNIYASMGMWNDVQKVRKIMIDRKVKKEPGCSWI